MYGHRSSRSSAKTCVFVRAFDWKLEASEEDSPVGASSAMNQFLRSAEIDMEDHSLGRWPFIKLKKNHMIGRTLTDIAIKSLYQFRWKTTPYIVEVAVNRRWTNISDMKEKLPNTDFGITLIGEHWSRAVDQATKNQWGDDLELLFNDEEDPVAAEGEERVQRFVDVIQGVGDVIDTVQEA